MAQKTDKLLALFNSGHHAEAERLAKKIIKQTPQLGFAWKVLAAAIAVQGRIAESLAPMRKVVELSPQDAEAHSNLGAVLKDLGRLAEAEASHRKALEIRPGSAEIHRNLGITLREIGRLNEAESCYRRALEIKPDYAEAHSNLGNTLKDLGRLTEAEACYRRALEFKPDHAEVHSNLGVTLKDQGRLVEAEASFRRALEIKPDHPEAHNNLGIVLYDLGRLPEAEACYRRALEIKPGYPEAHSNLGLILNNLGRLPEAEASYRKALEIKPGYADAHYNLGNTLNGLGRLVEAEDSYRRTLEIKPDFAEAHNNLGNTLKDLGRLPEAEACYRAALEIKPDYAEAHGNLGTTLKDLGRLPEAEARYHKALEIKPDYAEAHFLLGTYFDEIGKFDAAAAHFKSYLQIDPSDSLGALLFLAKLGEAPLPTKPTESHMNKLYNQRSHTWDHAKDYFGDRLVAEALEKMMEHSATPRGKWDVLDAGCGTGRVGALIREHARTLDGIDMSADMLREATAKGVYNHIHQSDLVSYMSSNPNKYDAITCAATLIHFGDLLPVFEAAATVLRDNGFFIFTLFPNDDDKSEIVINSNHGLAMGGCYAHGQTYVSRIALSTGFVIESVERKIHEYQKKTEEIMGLVFALRLARDVSNTVVAETMTTFAGTIPHQPSITDLDHAEPERNKTKQPPVNAVRTFLHVGCGPRYKDKSTRTFAGKHWRELRLDIDPEAKPDIIGTMLDMSAVGTCSIDAVFSSHNIEHLHPHEVPVALAEFKRVLRPDGFLVITCPDLQSVCALVAEDRLTDQIYLSPKGPIAPIDILYGHRPSMAEGNLYMAHCCGFTQKTLIDSLLAAGLRSVASLKRGHPYHDLWAVTAVCQLSEQGIRQLAADHFPLEAARPAQVG